MFIFINYTYCFAYRIFKKLPDFEKIPGILTMLMKCAPSELLSIVMRSPCCLDDLPHYVKCVANM
jgi:hypothetical protein